MQADRTLWPDWAGFLQRWGLRDIAVLLLDAAGPLSFLGAQLIYIGQPFFGRAAPRSSLTALASLLEDQAELKSFVSFLREDTPQ
jgi:hypothetical protein